MNDCRWQIEKSPYQFKDFCFQIKENGFVAWKVGFKGLN
jgi:hypothetical protein